MKHGNTTGLSPVIYYCLINGEQSTDNSIHLFNLWLKKCVSVLTNEITTTFWYSVTKFTVYENLQHGLFYDFSFMWRHSSIFSWVDKFILWFDVSLDKINMDCKHRHNCFNEHWNLVIKYYYIYIAFFLASVKLFWKMVYERHVEIKPIKIQAVKLTKRSIVV